jgi:hypothetical protein
VEKRARLISSSRSRFKLKSFLGIYTMRAKIYIQNKQFAGLRRCAGAKVRSETRIVVFWGNDGTCRAGLTQPVCHKRAPSHSAIHSTSAKPLLTTQKSSMADFRITSIVTSSPTQHQPPTITTQSPIPLPYQEHSRTRPKPPQDKIRTNNHAPPHHHPTHREIRLRDRQVHP